MSNGQKSWRAQVRRVSARVSRSRAAPLLIGLGVLCAVGLVVVVTVRLLGPPPSAQHQTPQLAAQQSLAPVTPPALPSPEEVESAPHPSVQGYDPPATETSSQTVIEDEPQAAVPSPAPSVSSPVPTSEQKQPEQQTALAVPVPPSALPVRPAAPSGERKAWERYALEAPPSNGHPIIAVIIDDMGVDKKRSERVLHLPGPLTISFMSYAQELSRLTEEARAHGHEMMMHVPMEPTRATIDPGPGALTTDLSLSDIRHRFDQDLDSFQGYVGINNHMGSKFTAYAPGMQVVMEELHKRGLLFIDSLTTEHSVGLELAKKAGIPTAGRNVFLDNLGDLASVQGQLASVEAVARKKGTAIAIGHPRDATIEALAAWLPTLRQKGFVLVPVTAVVRARMAEAQPTAAATH